MLVTELALQNAVGFPPAARLSLKAGLNALVSPDLDIVKLLLAVLAPTDDASGLFTPGAATKKAAITLVGRDGHTYRLVRDFVADTRSLLRSDPTTKQPIRISDDTNEIAGHLQELLGFPSDLRALTVVTAADLPSEQEKNKKKKGPKKAETLTKTATSLGGIDPDTVTPEEAKRKLPELATELERAERFEQAQDDLYTLQNRLGELSRGTEGVQEMDRQVAELEAKLAPFARVKEFTGGVETRIKKFPEAAARRDSALAELKKKREEIGALVEQAPTLADLGRDQMFLYGGGAGVACVVGAIALGVSFLWVADLIGFGIAAFAAWRWVDRVEGAEHSRRRFSDLGELEKRIQKQYDLDTLPVFNAIKALGVSTPDEALQRLEARDELEAQRMELIRQMDERRADPQLLALEQERESVEKDLRAREAIVNGMGFTRDAAVIRRDIESCEAVIKGAKAGAGDVLAPSIDAAAAFAKAEPRAFVEGLRDRLSQYLAALTDRRFVGLKPAAGGWHVVAAGGASGPLSGLSPADRDAIYVATRLTLAEKVAAPAKIPVVFDEPTLIMDAPHRALFVKMLRSLGALTQVIVRANDAPPASVVDHVAQAGAPTTSAPPPTT